jgi:hypothetical protein
LYLNLEDNGVPVTGLPVRGKESSLSLKITQRSQYSSEGPTQACRAANGLAQFLSGLAPWVNFRIGMSRHLRDGALRALAVQTNTPIETIEDLYHQEVLNLQATSSVKKFIEVIAGRRVKQRLLETRR